jgi:hypothetical protein
MGGFFGCVWHNVSLTESAGRLVDRSGIIVIVITIPFAFTRVSLHGIIVVVQGIIVVVLRHHRCSSIEAAWRLPRRGRVSTFSTA